jgi:DNA-binding transcriptional LysR family regulator
MGVAWMPDFYIRDDIAAGRLVTLLDEFAAEPLGIWLVYPHRRHLSLKVRLAVDHLAESLKSYA